MEHQTLGRRFICPIGPATEREFILDWRIYNMYTVLLSVQNLRGSSHYSQRVCVIDRTPVIKLYNSKLEWNYFKCSAESFRNNRYEWPQGWYCYNWLFMVFMTNILEFEYISNMMERCYKPQKCAYNFDFPCFISFMSFDWKYKAASQKSKVQISKKATNFYEISHLI